MERILNIVKLTALALTIVVAILCLGYNNAYGFNGPMQLTKPGERPQQSPNSTGTVVSTQFDYAVDDGSGFNDDDIPFGGENDRSVVPEPTTLILLGVGLAGIKLLKRRN